MKKELIQEFTQSYISVEETEKTVSLLEKKIKLHESQKANRDGRGVRHQVRKQVHKTTSHLKNAFRHRESHPDPTIRHAAAKLIRKIPHLAFEKLTVEASAFRGKLSKNTQRYNERRRQEGARIIPISHSLSLKEVRSLVELMSVGKTLENCVGRRFQADRYMRAVDQKTSELWILLRNGRVYGLMEIEIDHDEATRSIEECNTLRNESASLSHDEAMEILGKLQVTNVDDEAFARVGAYPAFLLTNVMYPLPSPIEIDRKWHFVWGTKNEIIVATTNWNPHSKDNKFLPEKLKWSQFSEDENEYRSPFSSFLSEGELLKIVLQSREFREALEDIRPTHPIGVDQAFRRPKVSLSK